ncbi:malate synthase A [Terriglobus sp.]|uniref:malate synthase A n=1 Tax=Terriglobus sp. TaxID=1889013 RepID=UPI003AFF8B3C
MTSQNIQLAFAKPVSERYREILSPEAIGFLSELHNRFGARRKELLRAREERLHRLNAGERPDFLPETRAIRESDWTVVPLPLDLQDRRVEITGPVDRKMIINALNSGAKVFMADFEDSTTPTWENLLEGQINLRDAVRRTISFSDLNTGKAYSLGQNPAVLFVRPRGWHLEERHVTAAGEAISGSLFDFGLYAFHNARELLNRSSGAYFYLPKMESHLEARLWNDVFQFAEETLGLPKSSIRGTVLIETILASFEMDEILWELREHSAGLNCGRWDYIFSFIKKFANDRTMLLPDRSQVTMTTHFMRSYSKLAIKTCHRRGTSAMGGMSALIPIKNDAEANERALNQVRADKEREASDGHDGTWVAHPALVPVAMEVFDRIMPAPNQIAKRLDDFNPTAQDLLEPPVGKITMAGVQQNVAVGLGYLEAWLRGIGCVPIFNLMEDAATAEISRAQLWQWVHHGARFDSGEPVTLELVDSMLEKELERVRAASSHTSFDAYERAAELMRGLIRRPNFVEFLTLPAYEDVLAHEPAAS